MKWFRKRSREQPAAGSDAHMMATLEELGIPLDFGTSNPADALTGGVNKATVYQAHLALEAGNTDDAVAMATVVIDAPDIALGEPRHAPIAAAAHYVRGAAHEAAGARDDARADFEQALARVPEHPGARAGLARLS